MLVKRWKSAVLAVVIALGTGVLTHGATLDEILGHVEKRCATMKDMSCTMTMEMKMMNHAVSAKGEMRVVVPNQYCVELVMKTGGEQPPMKMKMVSDGRIMYQEMKTGDKVMVNKIDMEASGMNDAAMAGGGLGMGGGMGNFNQDPGQMVAGMRKFMDLAVMDDETLEGGGKAWVIEGKFKPGYYRMMEAQGGGQQNVELLKSQMGGMRIFVGQKNEYVEKMEFLANDAEQTKTGVIELKNLKFNQNPAADLFKYTPAEGVAVNDMTETMRKQMEAVKKAMEAPEKAELAPAPAGVLKAGVPGPAFQAKTFDGKTIDLVAMRGKPALLFFWATYQKASVAQLVAVNKLAADAKGAIEVVALSLDEAGAAADVEKTVKEKGITVNVALGEAAVLDAYWITEVPSYVLLDADGKVVGSESKPKDLTTLEKTVNEITKK